MPAFSLIGKTAKTAWSLLKQLLAKIFERWVEVLVLGIPSAAVIWSAVRFGFTQTVAFLLTAYALPVWILSLVPMLLVIALVGWVRTRSRLTDALRVDDPRDTEVEYFGLRWILTKDAFFRNYETLFVNDVGERSAFFKSAVRGPSCPRCGREASASSVSRNECAHCQQPFSVNKVHGVTQDKTGRIAVAVSERSYAVSFDEQVVAESVRRAVYIEAQADYKRRKRSP